jgi:hypothetical protein
MSVFSVHFLFMTDPMKQLKDDEWIHLIALGRNVSSSLQLVAARPVTAPRSKTSFPVYAIIAIIVALMLLAVFIYCGGRILRKKKANREQQLRSFATSDVVRVKTICIYTYSAFHNYKRTSEFMSFQLLKNDLSKPVLPHDRA